MATKLSKYVARHAEPEAEAAARVPDRFGHAVVVPAYGERESLFRLLASVPGGPRGPVLVVVVLNARADSPPAAHAANDDARRRLAAESEGGTVLSDAPPIRVASLPGGALVVIDRAMPGYFLPEGQGVGLARKIGNDFVLRLHAEGRLATSWLHNTDADVVLPRDYFEQTESVDAKSAAAIYFYAHAFESDPDLALAGRLYEISLRYWVLGLAWAGSPYAYESMGSCLAIGTAAYEAVRGFPRKNAAEDFYVLDKLAKVGAIARLAGTPLTLEGRPSDRVPFGTGRALRDLVEKRRALAGFRLYHPLVFAHLAAWLTALDRTAASGGDLAWALSEVPADNPFFRADLLRDALEKLGAGKAIAEARAKSSDPATLRRHLHTWFDAFRTLKLAHSLRDGGLTSLPWREALAEAPFTGLSTETEDEPERLRAALADEEAKLWATPAGVPAMPPPPDA